MRLYKYTVWSKCEGGIYVRCIGELWNQRHLFCSVVILLPSLRSAFMQRTFRNSSLCQVAEVPIRSTEKGVRKYRIKSNIKRDLHGTGRRQTRDALAATIIDASKLEVVEFVTKHCQICVQNKRKLWDQTLSRCEYEHYSLLGFYAM